MGNEPRPILLHCVGALLCATYVVVLMGTAGDLAMSRDESFYVHAAELYANWFEVLADDPGQAFEQATIDRYWKYNHEHPALAKSAFALSWLAHQKWDLFSSDTLAFRFPAMLSAGLLLWLLVVWGGRARGLVCGVVAALAMALLPRFFYHAHLNCFDVPIVTAVAACAYCYWRSLDSRRWLFALGVVYGLALATKHNAWIVPGIFAVHWAFVVWGRRVAAKSQGDRDERAKPKKSDSLFANLWFRRVAVKSQGLSPWWLVAMAVIGVPIFVGTWPWLWHDGLARFGWYANFHIRHVHYNMAYFGTTYFQPPMPISFPWVMTLFTVPVTTLLLALLGIGIGWRRLLPPLFEKPIDNKNESLRPDTRYLEILWFGFFLAPLVVISLPSSPIFGGTKHWHTGYPFMALFAGVAAQVCFEHARRYLAERFRSTHVVRALAALPLALWLTPGFLQTAHAHPFGLSHYGPIAGGVAGAADLGMNRQFWGFTHGSMLDWFKEHLPDGGSVWTSDATHKSWSMLHRDGLLPENIRATGNMVAADVAIVHLEHHFVEEDYQIWEAFGTTQPAYVLTYDGVPIVNVYANPKSKRYRAVPEGSE